MSSKIETFDICIIGGSIAGNYLCYLLADTNLRISVIEEHHKIGIPFQCAGIVSQKLANIIDLPNNIILNRVKIAKIVAPNGSYIKLSGEENPFIIDRVALDQLFYDKVKSKKNIVYYLREKFKEFEYIKENGQRVLLVRTNKRIINTRILIGCDGPLSLVGKYLNVQNKILYAMQIRIRGTFNEDEAVLFFDERWKKLFGWIVPEGNNIYRIGLATSSQIKKKFKTFLTKLGVKFEDKINQQGGIIPFGHMNKLAFNNILLLGDSAGQVKATTGGGIIMLLTAAKFASNCIKMCFERNNFSRRIIKKYYQTPCRNTIGKELKIHYLIRLILERFSPRDFEIFFEIVKMHNIEKLISIYGDMDFPKRMLIEMIKNPRVIRFLFQFFLKKPLTLIRTFKLLK